jgi:hypothetical protein
MLTSVGVPEPRAEEPKLNCLLEPELKITNCGSGYFLFIKDLKKFYLKKSWLLQNFLVNFYTFNPIRVKHASIYLYSSQKKYFSWYLKKLFGAGAGAAIHICGSAEPESEPKEIFSAPQHCW